MKLSCTNPRLIFADKENHVNAIQVPCGKCHACLRKRSLDWTTRCVFESRSYGADNCCFVTLTYNPDSLPKDGLCKRHLQNWLKVLRGYLYPAKLRFYACGEYGTHGKRPHYHVILFGVSKDTMDFMVLSKNAFWRFGFVSVGFATERSIAYTAGYCNKSYSWPKGKTPIFRVMSRRPGLGLRYFEENRDEIMRTTSVLPRYLDNKLFVDGSVEQLAHKQSRSSFLDRQFKADSDQAFIEGKNVYRYRREQNWQRELDFRSWLRNGGKL